MSKKLKKRIKRVAIGAAIYLIAVISSHLLGNMPEVIRFLLFIAAYIVIGGDVVKKAIKNIGKGQVFDENFLMMVATVGAILVKDYSEAVAVMLFYQVGECFQSYAVSKSRKSITDLMDIRPDHANVMRDGEWIEIAPEEAVIGEIIMVKPGEKVPLDGTVIEGSSTLDTMTLTGESLPRDIKTGEEIISGCVNGNGVLQIRVSKEFGQSTVAKILDLVENAGNKKAQAENFITKFARYYTPIVVICAVLLAIIPPIILGGGWSDWIYRALEFLVISCPCALVISIPLSFFGGLGGASKAGILVKGSNYLEALADAELIVMDKTGTLTKGNFAVTKIRVATGVGYEDFGQSIQSEEMSLEDCLLQVTAMAESFSTHPISVSLQNAYGKSIDKELVSQVEETAGFGVAAQIADKKIYAGNENWMEKQHKAVETVDAVGTLIHVASDEKYLGCIVIADEIKPDAKKAIEQLKASGMKQIVMLTGDHRKVAEDIAGKLGITQYYAELLPGDKVEKVEELFAAKSAKGKLIFIGDGINDAPVLARADVGIAMGGLGSDAAIEAADIVIMTDEPSKIAQAMKISHRTLRIVRQNIVFALGVKLLVLLLAALGMVSMWAAVFADVGVAFLAILNAMRALHVKE